MLIAIVPAPVLIAIVLAISISANLSAQSCPTTNTTITNEEFSGLTSSCPAETNIVCPLVTSISNYAFAICTSLKSVTFLNAKSIGEYAFNGCSSLESAMFPNAESIGEYAFEFCTSLKNVTFPNAVTIGSMAFSTCPNLEKVTFPNAVTIGSMAFSSCTSLKSIALPNAVTIGSIAFSSCASLESITLGSTPPTIGTDVFFMVPSTCKVYVPYSTTDTDSAEYVTILTAAGFNGTVERLPLTYTYTYTLAIITPVNGSVLVDSDHYTSVLTFTEGDNVELESFPNGCYQFVNWTDVSNNVVSADNPLNMVVKSDTILIANFTTTTATYTLSLDDDGNGTAAGSGGSLTGITCGDSRIITATADACYEFAKWTNSNGDSIYNVSPLSITLYKDTVIKANFKLISPAPTYTLSVSSNPTMGTASSSVSSATCGSNVTVTATPNAGYKFLYWQEGGAIVSTADTYIFNITANRVLTAVFDDAKKKTRIKKINVKKGRVRIKPQP